MSFNKSIIKDSIINNTTFTDINLEGVHFQKTCINEVTFNTKQMNRIEFHDKPITHTNITSSYLKGAKFIETPMDDVTFTDCNLEGIQFINLDLKNVTFANTEMIHAFFKNINCDKVSFNEDSILKNATFKFETEATINKVFRLLTVFNPYQMAEIKLIIPNDWKSNVNSYLSNKNRILQATSETDEYRIVEQDQSEEA